MKKNLMRVLSILLSLAFLTGCTLPGSNPSPFDNAGGELDPVKPLTGNDQSSNPGDTQIDIIKVPASVEVTYEVRDDSAAVDITVTAIDDAGEAIWRKTFEKVMVGQYDSHTAIGIVDKGYYIVVAGTLYCLGLYSGDEIWSVEGVGASCSWDFDDQDNLYIAGYEGPRLAVIDKKGNVVNKYDSLKNADDFQDYYWTSGLYYEDGKVRCTYDSTYTCLIIDPATGIASEEEFGEINISGVTKKWDLNHYASDKDRDTHFASELDGQCTLSISDGYYLTFSYANGDDKYECSYVSCYLRPFDLFEGIRDDYYGVWTFEGKADDQNSFAFQMSEPDTLNLLWFRKDENGNDIGYMSFEFMDAEVLQYYHDKLELNNK